MSTHQAAGHAASVSPVNIVHCDDSRRAEWDAYLAEMADGSFYHRFDWKAINERQLGHRTFYLAAERDGALAGVLPLVRVSSRLFGRILCSMPFVNFGGPVSQSREVTKALLERAQVIADEQRADYLELRCQHQLPGELPSSQHKVSMTLTLDADPDTLWNAFKSKHRTNIRRAYKNGIEVRTAPGASLLEPFYQLMLQAWREHGTPLYRKAYFRDIAETFGEAARIFVAYVHDTPVAAAFNGHFGETVEGMWAASPSAYRRLQPNYVLYWEMMRHACESGFKRYHLGRSTADSEAEDFKRKWNAETTQLYWYYYLPAGDELPQLNTANPKYALAIRAWQHLPLSLTRQLGPFLANYIP